MSLRARLLIGLVVLSAAGLLVAGVATYRAERSFLYTRVENQLLASRGVIQAQVDQRARLTPGTPGAEPPGGDGDGDDTYTPPTALGGPAGLPAQEQPSPPPGTFGEYIDPAGHRRGEPFTDSEGYEYPPALPAAFPISQPGHPQLFTVPAAGDSGLSYLVLAQHSNAGPGTAIFAVSLSDVDASLGQLQSIEAIVIGSVLAAIAICSWLAIRVGLRPLDRIGETAGAIAAGDLSRRVSPSGGRTEVGRLGLALNAMLGQIERAFAKQQASEERLRRFLSDAAHELRTPLTSIRGYAELFRLGATARPADTAKAMARIEEEAARMGILVEELLALARLDEMPATTREPVDLAPLLADAADDARAVAADRSVTVAVEGTARGAPSAHVVLGDPHQLRQVLANLMGNAIKHTPAGTPIELTLQRRAGMARIEVRDHGHGLPEDSSDAVFERFWRAEAGRERGKAGAGLGLAIVAEIVGAHGGEAQAGNAPGGGASFVITLPLMAAGAAGAAAGAASPPPPRRLRSPR